MQIGHGGRLPASGPVGDLYGLQKICLSQFDLKNIFVKSPFDLKTLRFQSPSETFTLS